jgi:hypothetical protein
MALRNDGSLFISDRANHAVRQVTTKGMLQTILRGVSAHE